MTEKQNSSNGERLAKLEHNLNIFQYEGETC